MDLLAYFWDFWKFSKQDTAAVWDESLHYWFKHDVAVFGMKEPCLTFSVLHQIISYWDWKLSKMMHLVGVCPNSYSCTMLVPGLLFVAKKKKEIQTCGGDFTPTCTIFLNSSMMQFLPVDSSSRELVRCFMKMCIVSIIPRSSGRRQRLKMNLHSIFQVPYLFSVFSRYSFC